MAEPIIVDIPGVGPTAFETEDQALQYFQKQKSQPGHGQADALKELFRAPLSIDNIPEEAQSYNPLDEIDLKDSPVATAIMSGADAYGAGIPKRGAALIDAFIKKFKGQGDSVVDGADRGMGDLYNESLSENKDLLNRLGKENQGANIAGAIVGSMAPGSVFNQAFKGASSLPFISKLMGATKTAKVGGKLIEKPAVMKQILGTALRGGTANAVAGQVEEGLNTDLGDRAEELASDFGVGAAFDAGTFGGLKGVRAMAGLPINSAKWLGQKIKQVSEKAPFGIGDLIKENRLNKFSNKIDDVASATGTADKQVAGRQVQEKVKAIGKEASDQYNSFVSENLKKYGSQKVSVNKLRQSLIQELKSEGVIDDTGKIVDDSLELIFESDLRPTVKRLVNQLTSLKENPTLAELENITKKIGHVAKFNKGARGPKDKIFGSLYNSARENLFDGIEEAAVKKGMGSGEYQSAKNALDKFRQEATDLQDVINYNPAQHGPEFQGAKQSVQKQISGQKQELEKLVQKYEQEGLSAKEAIKQARKTISENIKVSEGPIGDLVDQYPEEVIKKAKGTGKLDLGSVVDEALTVNAAYKDPIKQAVMADIIDRANDPKSLKKVMDVYEAVIPKILDPQEIEQLSKLSGTFKKAPGKISKNTSYILNLFQGGSKNPGTTEMLPRAAAPVISRFLGRQKDERLAE